ncbi:MAG: septation protein A [Gammaproteobacteria bacterium]|nr:septation protein A [Gammaproteobacteria bacterium]
MKKLLFDFFPIILFFVAYKLPSHETPTEGVIFATGVAIVANLIQVIYSKLRFGHVEKMQLVTLGLFVVMGGLTIYFEDEAFIKWKPTVVNWLFGLVFLGSQVVGKQPLVQRLMGKQLELPDPVWSRLNFLWVLFFIFSGAANLYVVFNYDTDTWVDFKLFGLLGITVVFVIIQTIYVMRHLKEEDAASPSSDPETKSPEAKPD